MFVPGVNMSHFQAMFADFCSHTSLHGWSYMSNPSLSSWRRVFWLLMIVSSLGVAAYYLRWFVHNFDDHKVSTTIETTTAPLSQVDFPAVTICNVNQFQKSFLSSIGILNDVDLAFKFAEEFIIGTENIRTDLDKRRAHAVLQRPQYKSMAKEYLQNVLKLNQSVVEYVQSQKMFSVNQLVNRLSVQWQIGAMIPYAEFQGIEHVASIGTYAGTDHGICAKIFPQTFDVANMIPERNEAIQRKIKAPPGVKNGVNNGMTFMVDAEIYDYADLRSPSNGFVLALHHHLDIPVIQQQGFNVAPGTFTQIALTPILESTTNMAKIRFKPEDRGCYFQSEINLEHWPYDFKDTLNPEKRSEGGRYSMSNCLYEAVLEEIPSQCNCTPNFHAIGFNVETHPPCEGRGITCVTKLLNKLGILDTIQDGASRKRCFAACETQINRYQLSTIPYPNTFNFLLRTEVCRIVRSLQQRCELPDKRLVLEETYESLCGLTSRLNGNDACFQGKLRLSRIEYFNANATARLRYIELLQRYAHENIAIIQVYIKDPFVTKLLRDEAFSVVLFVAGAGGLMGLCTGFSFLSGVEILYFAVIAFIENIQQGAKTIRASSTGLRQLHRRRKSTFTEQTDAV